MKKYILTLILLFIISLSFAQKNRIEIGISKYKFYNVSPEYTSSFKQYQIGYERELNKYLSTGIKYTLTKRYGALTYEGFSIPADPNHVVTRRGYNFIHAYLAFRKKLFKSQLLSAGIGPSMTFGENEYITKISGYYDVLIWRVQPSDE